MSQPSWKNQLILASILFVLGSVVYWHEFKFKPRKTETEEQTKKVFNLKGNQIQSIRMVSDGKVFEFTCADIAAQQCKPGDNAKWQLQTPLKIKGDSANINSLVSTLSNLTINETVNLAEETPEKKAFLLKEYGLDEASRKTSKKLEVTTPAGKTTLHLGQAHPMGETVFGIADTGQLDDSKVYLVPNYVKSNLDHDLTHWREKKILAFGAPDVEAFEINDGSSTLKSAKKDGKWEINVGGKAYSGDNENIDSLLASLGYLSAKNFVSDKKNSPEASNALAGAKVVLTFDIQKHKGDLKTAPAIVTLKFYEKHLAKKIEPAKKTPQADKALYLVVSDLDPLYEIDYFNLSRLKKGPKDLRLTKLISSVERFGAKHLEFTGKPMGMPLGLAQKDGKWVDKTDGSPVNNEKVQAMLDKLSGNKIKDFLNSDAALVQGEKDGLMIMISGDGNQNKRQLAFWKKNGKLYGRDLGSSNKEIYLVDASVQDGLPWDRNFFKGESPKADKKAK